MSTKKRNILFLAVALIIIFLGVYFFAFSDKKYVVTFDANGGVISSTTEKITTGTKIGELTKPTREGYSFLYWTSDGKILSDSDEIKHDMKLVAIWESNTKKYTITFDTDGGSTIESIEVGESGLITKPENPTKTGYKFLYWTLNGVEYDFTQSVTGPVSLKAKWENAKQFVVTFNTDGGSTIESQKIYDGSIITKPDDPKKSGYIFNGWQLDGKNYDFSTIISKNITLTAVWLDDPNTKKYTVTFNSNGGSNISSKTVLENSKVTKPTNPTKENYIFVSWQLNEKDYDFNKLVTDDITLVAKWRTANKYTVTFDLNGGTGNIPSQTVTEGNKVVKPSNPTRSGYKFNGWDYDFNKEIAKNTKITAKWIQNVYIVKVTIVDDLSPVRKLTVYENGKVISVKEIKANGYTLCNSSNMSVNNTDLEGLSKVTVVLNSGANVSASIS